MVHSQFPTHCLWCFDMILSLYFLLCRVVPCIYYLLAQVSVCIYILCGCCTSGVLVCVHVYNFAFAVLFLVYACQGGFRLVFHSFPFVSTSIRVVRVVGISKPGVYVHTIQWHRHKVRIIGKDLLKWWNGEKNPKKPTKGLRSKGNCYNWS